MRELIYRRAASGYTIDRSAEGISQAKRHTGSQYVGVAMDETGNGISYRQFRLDDGTIALSAAYLDKYGDRKSILGHIVYADEDEVEAVLNSYPSCTGYFARFKSEYEKDQSLAGNNNLRMIFPVEEFLDPRKDGLKLRVLEILKRVFPVKENLVKMFDALLDVAGNNPKMILILGPEEESDKMAERGRQIIESLFACLPNVISQRIGYISPAVNDKGNTVFGIRYSKKREIDREMRSFAYVYSYTENTFSMPIKPDTAAHEYADELAELVFRCDQKALDRIFELKALLNDPALYNNESVSEELIIRYHFYNGYEKLTSAEKEWLLNWYTKVVVNIRNTGNTKEKTDFWSIINRWIAEVVLKDIYLNAPKWDQNDPVYSFKRLKTVFETAQLVHEMSWKEAKIYKDYFKLLLSDKIRLNAESRALLEKSLLQEIIKKAKAADFSEKFRKCLYWPDLEKWFSDQWQNGNLFRNKEAVATAEKLYEQNTEHTESYVIAYAGYCEKNNIALTSMAGSLLGRKVIEYLIAERREYVVDQIKRELKKTNPFISKENLGKYLLYKSVIGKDEELTSVYASICEEHYKAHLSGMQRMNIEALIDDLNGIGPENALSGVMKKIHPLYNINETLENKIIEMTKNEGIFPYYPENPQLARKVAGILDTKFPQADYMGKLRVLERANHIHEENIDSQYFESLMETGFGEGRDSVLSSKVRELIWKNLLKLNEGKTLDFDRLLVLTTLRNRTSGAFNPVGIKRDLERLGIEEKKIKSLAKKYARLDENRGIGYVASILLKYCSHGGNDNIDDWQDYPGERISKIIRNMFSGFPMGVAIALLLFSGSGFAVTTIGILKTIGLL